MKRINRRNFLKIGLGSIVTVGMCGCATELDEVKEKDKKKTTDKVNDKKQDTNEVNNRKTGFRKLGKTGLEVSLLGLGGSMTIAQAHKQEEAVQMINKAIDNGVNFIDTAPTYGASEDNIGQVMLNRRQEVVLATKTIDRSYDGTMQLIEQSLNRLNTDYIDIYQLHGVHTDDDLDKISASDGAWRALKELKAQGVIGLTGITTHRDPQVAIRSIKEMDFDCLLMSLNPADIYYQPMQKELMAEALHQDMGIIAMKVVAYGRIFRDNGISTMQQALGYVLSFPVHCAIVGVSNIDEIIENIEITANFTPYSKDELEKLEKLVKSYEQEVNFFKTQW
ncbi:hypothetical protein SYNTR_0756 [Candidatus Syntrophocurvum alkaliphilum]|uniref:NADP-dependent oxidoreductase domain-containing protein n=1 Tax=Candidatus Syntrophocurvum alkaliphilum TaxID=2293317 RepID=A0A6I6DAD8_9FIRM|nr:aldo/keto reductase [Candidatus Syntrophocurvum alkaliphilum]QGT99349.1 hypothetical protein SYNTR_0756 [Candidatus Syntrophocurvum alkaliphilum]